jgi:hypothetical protein
MHRLHGIVVLASLLVAPAMAAGAPRLYLTWHAPYGEPGASATLEAPCGTDSTGRDTLFLVFEPGRDDTSFIGLDVTLYFRAASGDSLGPMWWFGGGTQNPRNIQIQFMDQHHPGLAWPWKWAGFGASAYDRTRGTGRLQITYGVALQQTQADMRDSTRYRFARILIPRPLASQPSCQTPVCIEAQAELAFRQGEDTQGTGVGSRRYVSWNSPAGEVCGAFGGDIAPAQSAGTGKAKAKNRRRSR